MKKIILALVCIISIFSIDKEAYAASGDFTMPTSKVYVEEALLKDGIYYTTSQDIELIIDASDDVTSPENLKMYISNDPATGTMLANLSAWENFQTRKEWPLPGDIGDENYIYVYIKDEAGNISPNVINSTKKYTVRYSADGASNVPDAQTTYLGQPFAITAKEPFKDDAYFKGWSLVEGATSASWLSDTMIEPKYINSNITLYAVWEEDTDSVSDIVDVGDWIEFPIDYGNASTSGDGSTSNLTGWRVLSISGDRVKLISAGTPLTFKNENSAETVKKLTEGFLDCKPEDFETYEFEHDLNIEFSQMFIEKVEAVTEVDIKEIIGAEDILGGDTTEFGGVLNNGTYYYVASEDSLFAVIGSDGTIQEAEEGQTYGVRIVITLSKNIPVVGKQPDGAWEIDIPKYLVTVPNEPVLGNNMKAVYWSGDNAEEEFYADEFTSEMYNYTFETSLQDTKKSRWANAITVDDGSYWVWIPRYAYKIRYFKDETMARESKTKTKYGYIDIVFMYGTSNDLCLNLKGEIVSLPEGYKVHPAFQAMEDPTETTSGDAETGNQLGKWNVELPGIWFAKYEPSQEDLLGDTWMATTEANGGSNAIIDTTVKRLVSKPSRVAWSNMTINRMFQNSVNMNKELNSHMIKNSEWGAMAYLAYSRYGRNTHKIGMNQSDSNYTGGGPGSGESSVANDSYGGTIEEFKNEYAWNTEQGKLASTTGNIYGVYDVVGGTWEQLAAYLDNTSYVITDTRFGGELGKTKDMKMKQVYKSSAKKVGDYRAADYELNKDIYGDAVYETSITFNGNDVTWQDAWAQFPSKHYVFIGRAGSQSIFYFDIAVGQAYPSIGFRTGLCVGEEFKLTFNANGGVITENSSETIEKKAYNGNIFGTLPEATREGYTFDGWHIGSENGTEITAETFADITTKGKTIYARWE